MRRKISVFIFLGLTVLALTTCKRDEDSNLQTIYKLYFLYKNGEISECKYQESPVFEACINAVDAGFVIYDNNGNTIGKCNYAYGQVDVMCSQLTDCEVVYRCTNHISGLPPVDKYNFGH